MRLIPASRVRIPPSPPVNPLVSKGFIFLGAAHCLRIGNFLPVLLSWHRDRLGRGSAPLNSGRWLAGVGGTVPRNWAAGLALEKHPLVVHEVELRVDGYLRNGRMGGIDDNVALERQYGRRHNK